MKTVIVTGAGGLIGSESVEFFCEKGFNVIGIDNDKRAYFFGKEASTEWNIDMLSKKYQNFKNHHIDIRDYEKKDENYLGLVELANSLIVYKRLILG